MSGGSYNYIYSRLLDECEGRMYDAEMNDLIKDLCEVLHDLEWWQSSDSSESCYRNTLAKFKAKWFKGDRQERLKGYIDEQIGIVRNQLYSLIGEPQESEAKKCTYKETGCGSCKWQLDCPIDADGEEMTDEEAIETLKVAKSEIEWEYPMDYQIALDMAIKALEQNPYKDFCEFVAKMVLRNDFEENAGANAEFLCRKLSKLGIVKADEDKWVLVESEEKE